MEFYAGMAQIISKKKEIEELLMRGFTKIYIYNQLQESGKIRIGRKRFYEILKKLELKKAELHHIRFPGETIVQQTQQQTSNEVITKGKRKKLTIESDEEQSIHLQQKQSAIAAFHQHNRNSDELV